LNTTSPRVETDVLIVGTGPAGAAAATLLATYGVRPLVISKYHWTARTPRSHITNQRTMEVLRDLGLEDEAKTLATPNELMGENTYCTSLTGVELGRLKTWGTQPGRMSDYETASPTRICDLPQNLLEPMLVTAASHRGARVRFDTEYVSAVQDADGVTVQVHDRLTGETYAIRARYLMGCDGANSKVLDDIGLPLEGKMGVAGSINIVFDADLSPYVAHRPSVLYWIVQPGADGGGLGLGLVRMVRPWHRWLAIWNYDIDEGAPEVSEAHAVDIVRQMVGVPDLDVHIDSASTWTVNDMYARELSRGRVFCLGDAVHRHPPTNGLGSNTSIQDAYNLSWKLAHVLKGQAGPELLDTYSVERAPVAEQVVRRANDSIGCFPPILRALGLTDTRDPEQMERNVAALKDATPEAGERRQALRVAMDASDYVYNCHGVEMNRRYASAAMVSDGSPEPVSVRDAELYHQPSSRPGANMPHAWLSRGGHKVSTLDLCGKGRFTLLTDPSGDAWVRAAVTAAASVGVDVETYVVGPGWDVEDPYGDYRRLSELEEGGALLIRPDGIVAWRSRVAPAKAMSEVELELAGALCRILAREPVAANSAAESALQYVQSRR
jgi:2,4-dichlorophenol 6-monooxygenase